MSVGAHPSANDHLREFVGDNVISRHHVNILADRLPCITGGIGPARRSAAFRIDMAEIVPREHIGTVLAREAGKMLVVGEGTCAFAEALRI